MDSESNARQEASALKKRITEVVVQASRAGKDPSRLLADLETRLGAESSE